ncbi:MAG TPA: aspartyl/asparaginyl beta-hydroxylase domain-containing protein [Bacteroidia bacterium]|nr:aspartyl/asparaginyl beta-hydroxylase domain-containing protein [Bacteroidia bacterium]
MFIDYTQYPFLNKFVDNINTISDEFEQANTSLKDLHLFVNDVNPTIFNHVDYWIKDNRFHPDDIGYEAREGIWGAFPLYKMGYPINWYNVKEHFPKTYELLKTVPNLNFASFMRLDSQAKTMPHKHQMKNNIFHLLLNDLDKPCFFNVNGQETSLQFKGDALLFDYSLEHSSFNASSDTRITFTIDFDPFFLIN